MVSLCVLLMFFLLWLVGSVHFIPAGIGYGFIPLHAMPQILVNTEGAGPLPHGLECGQCARLWGSVLCLQELAVETL